MAEQDSENKDNQQAEAPVSEEVVSEEASAPQDDLNIAGEGLSLEDLDSLLESEDPEFQKEMQEISEDDVLQSAEVEDEVEESEPEPSAPQEDVPLSRFKKFKVFLVRHIQKWRGRVNGGVRSSINIALALKSWTLKFIKTDLPLIIGKVTRKIKAIVDFLKYLISQFRAQSRMKKLFLLGLILIFSGTIYLLQQNIKGRWIPYLSPPLVKSFLEKGVLIRRDATLKYVSLDLAFPEPAFTVLLKRITVNLKPTRGFANPLASFQFYVDADTQDTAIELRHRDNELSDYISRELEGFTYLEATSSRGRRKIKNIVRETINQALNRGRVRAIYAKTYEVRP